MRRVLVQIIFQILLILKRHHEPVGVGRTEGFGAGVGAAGAGEDVGGFGGGVEAGLLEGEEGVGDLDVCWWEEIERRRGGVWGILERGRDE